MNMIKVSIQVMTLDLEKTKNTQTKRYRKNVDQAYDNLDQLVMFIKDHEKLNELSSELNNLKNNIDNKDYESSISIIDNLFEKLGEVSGAEEFANRLDDLYSLIDSEEKESSKINDTLSEILIWFCEQYFFKYSMSHI